MTPTPAESTWPIWTDWITSIPVLLAIAIFALLIAWVAQWPDEQDD